MRLSELKNCITAVESVIRSGYDPEIELRIDEAGRAEIVLSIARPPVTWPEKSGLPLDATPLIELRIDEAGRAEKDHPGWTAVRPTPATALSDSPGRTAEEETRHADLVILEDWLHARHYGNQGSSLTCEEALMAVALQRRVRPITIKEAMARAVNAL